MDPIKLIRIPALSTFTWSLLFVGGTAVGQGADVARQTPSARIQIQDGDVAPVAVEVNGERIKGDGRLRYVGSLGSGSDALRGVRWTFVCDPNPNGGASMEGRFDVKGPFDGWVAIEMPINPIIDGPAALQVGGSLRASTDHAGVVLAIDREEHALQFLVDRRMVDQFGRGPFTIQRATPGATMPRSWSTGEKDDRRAPIIVDRCRDRLTIRTSCRIEAGVEAMFTARLRLVGSADDFIYRDAAADETEGVIPRSDDSISISVTGAGKGRGARTRNGDRPNKPAAVVRQVAPGSTESGASQAPAASGSKAASGSEE